MGSIKPDADVQSGVNRRRAVETLWLIDFMFITLYTQHEHDNTNVTG